MKLLILEKSYAWQPPASPSFCMDLNSLVNQAIDRQQHLLAAGLLLAACVPELELAPKDWEAVSLPKWGRKAADTLLKRGVKPDELIRLCNEHKLLDALLDQLPISKEEASTEKKD